MDIKLVRGIDTLSYDTQEGEYNNFTHSEFMRYLVGRFSNRERLIGRWIKPNLQIVEDQRDQLTTEEVESITNLLNLFVKDFNDYTAFSFMEAWEIKNEALQKAVFDTIDIKSMIQNLKGERIKVDGINVDNIMYNDNGTVKGVNKDHNNIFEIWRCDASSLNIGEDYIYALKMWCTSTDKEHFVWISEDSIENPLDAIAGTFSVHKNVLEKMTCIKRQGDILVVETSEAVEPAGEIVKLTKEQYFGNLVSQS